MRSPTHCPKIPTSTCRPPRTGCGGRSTDAQHQGEPSMATLTLDQASIIVDKALEKGRELKLQPLTVIVLDAGGQLKAMKREDRSSLLRPEIAMGKAWGTLGMGFGGREFARRVAAGNTAFIQALTVASGGRIVPVPGGVLIRDTEGET